MIYILRKFWDCISGVWSWLYGSCDSEVVLQKTKRLMLSSTSEPLTVVRENTLWLNTLNPRGFDRQRGLEQHTDLLCRRRNVNRISSILMRIICGFFFFGFRFTFLSYVILLWSPSQGRRIRQEVEDISGTYIYFLGTYNNVQTKLIMMSDREKSWWSCQYVSYECALSNDTNHQRIKSIIWCGTD